MHISERDDALVPGTGDARVAPDASDDGHRKSPSEQRFRTAVLRAAIPMAYGDIEEDQAAYNDAMCEFFGLSREQLETTSWRSMQHPDDDAKVLPLTLALERGEIDRYEALVRFIVADGRTKWGRLTVSSEPNTAAGMGWAIAQIVDVTKEVEAQHALQRMVDDDPVTGLHSRTWMTQRLRELLRMDAGTGRRTGVIYVELAPYLVIYRAHGFEAGDKVLRQLGARLQPILPPDALLGRFEGMTLLVMLPDVRSRADMEQLCVDILENVAQELEVAGRRISRTGNIGAAVSHPHSSAVSLLQDADQALLRAEVGGRARWHIVGWEDTADEEPLEPVDLEHELRVALDTGQFFMHYQPQVHLLDRSISGYEALVRWQHPTRGLIGPGGFMPLMESTGLIGRLGRQVLAMVCERIKTETALAGPIAVNVSAIELDDAGWLENVIDTIRISGIDPTLLVIELTETTVLDLTGRARESLQSLRDLGVGIHVDDFGTGYTSVATLLAMPCTAVKLDMSLSARLVNPSDSDISLIRAIATLAASLGLETIAEGIEDEQQARLLAEAGWLIGQGYLFGRPSEVI